MQLRVTPDAAEDLCSIHLRKRDVEDDDVGLALLKTLYRFNSTRKFLNFVLILKNSADDQTIVGVIVHDSHYVHAKGNNNTSKTAVGFAVGAAWGAVKQNVETCGGGRFPSLHH